MCQCESLCRNNDIPVTLSACAIIVILCALTSLLIAAVTFLRARLDEYTASSNMHVATAQRSVATPSISSVILIFPSARRCEHARPSAHSIFHCLRGSLPRLRQCNNDCFACAMTQYRIDRFHDVSHFHPFV